LPIAVLEGRTQGCLYIPLAGWAIFAGVTFVDLAKAAARFLASEPFFRRWGQGPLFAALVTCTVLSWIDRTRDLKRVSVRPAAARQGVETARVIEQLKQLHPSVRPRSQVVFLNDPFTDWDMTFISMLWFDDRSIHVYNQRLEHLSSTEMARMDYVFDFQQGKLVEVK
jgi:hypothetical protein